jgi:hypothetical protein
MGVTDNQENIMPVAQRERTRNVWSNRVFPYTTNNVSRHDAVADVE